MKNIKLRIVYLILGAALLLFALFMLAVNLIIPAHFVSEAKKALISEAQYQNRTIPYTDEEPIYDEGEEEGNFFTPSIVFLELDDGYRPNTWNRDSYRLEKKLLEYCAGRDIALNQCYTFKTDKHHLIFMSVQEEQDDWEKPYAYIMYIDIGPITRYIVTLGNEKQPALNFRKVNRFHTGIRTKRRHRKFDRSHLSSPFTSSKICVIISASSKDIFLPCISS